MLQIKLTSVKLNSSANRIKSEQIFRYPDNETEKWISMFVFVFARSICKKYKQTKVQRDCS